MDGARLAYGLMAEGNDVDLPVLAANCDVFYIGGTKVGALFGEAVVILNEGLKPDFRYHIKQRGGMQMCIRDSYLTVVLDTNLTPELVEEGFVREIISKIQTMRKEAGFEVMDHISVYQDDNDRIAGLLKANADEIKAEVMADTIFLGRMGGYAKEWSINGEKVMLGVEKTMK